MMKNALLLIRKNSIQRVFGIPIMVLILYLILVFFIEVNFSLLKVGIYMLLFFIFFVFLVRKQVLTIYFHSDYFEVHFHLLGTLNTIKYTEIESVKGFYNRGLGTGLKFNYNLKESKQSFLLLAYDKEVVALLKEKINSKLYIN